MKQNEKLVLGGILALFVLLLGFTLFNEAPAKKTTLGMGIPMSVTGTNSSSTVGANTAFVTTVLAQFNGAQVRAISNTGGVVAYLSCNSTSTGFVAATGRPLFASTTLEMTDDYGNLCRQNIYALTISGTTTLSSWQF